MANGDNGGRRWVEVVTRVHVGPKAEVRLDELDIQHDWLVRTVLAAEMARQNTSALEPSAAPGVNCYFAGVRVLAEQLLTEGAPYAWQRVEQDNMPLMINRTQKIAIGVCSGDAAVGLPQLNPKSKNPRGPQSVARVDKNDEILQLSLFDEQPRDRPIARVPDLATWWLMTHSTISGTVRGELSLPILLGDGERFSSWQERIILDIPDINGDLRRRADDDTAELDIVVKRRA